MLSQLSYSPVSLVGLGGLEPPTSPLSGVRSNQLSYIPTPVDRAFIIAPVALAGNAAPGALVLENRAARFVEAGSTWSGEAGCFPRTP